MNNRNTDKRVALVTGASSGIGEAAAQQLMAAGFTVYGTSRRGAAGAQRAFPLLALDVTDEASVQAAIAELVRCEGRIDLLVNNAGSGITGAAEESSIDQVRALFDQDLVRIEHGGCRPAAAGLRRTPRQLPGGL